MKILLISLLMFLTSCGGKFGHIEQGVIQGNTMDLKVGDFCTLSVKEIDLRSDFTAIEDAVYEGFSEITVGVSYDFGQEEALYVGSLLNQILEDLEIVKQKSNGAYFLYASCVEGYDFREMKSYGDVKQLLNDDPFFDKLEKEGMAVLSKDQLHKFQVDLTKVGVGRNK